MAHPCLEGSQWDSRSCAAGAKGVPKVVEPHFADASALECSLEAFADLAAFERVPGVWVREDEVVLGLVGGGLEQQL